MIYYAQTYSPWRGWHMRRYPPLGRNWRRALRRGLRGAVFGAAVSAACVSLLALGAYLDRSESLCNQGAPTAARHIVTEVLP